MLSRTEGIIQIITLNNERGKPIKKKRTTLMSRILQNFRILMNTKYVFIEKHAVQENKV